MTRIEPLRPDHAKALYHFEHINRDYFAASIPDRGDNYFAFFDQRHRDLLTEQADGSCYFHVIIDNDGTLLGRINLVGVDDRCAELGYRIAHTATGKGIATTSVITMCDIARDTYQLTTLTAETTLDNAGSRAVLAKAGFTKTSHTMLGHRPAARYVRVLK